MTEPTIETHAVSRGSGTLTVKVAYTPRTALPLRLYRLKLEVTGVTGGISPYVFVYQRATVGAPMEDGSPRDEFVCVADELDEDEINAEVQGPDVAHGNPYYRSKSVELLFRNSDQMYEAARSLLSSLSVTA